MNKTWECVECDYECQWSENELATEGEPICPNCDTEMFLIKTQND